MTKPLSELPEDYGSLLLEVRERIRAAHYQALRAVNKERVGLYWDIGRLIVERQAGDTWGKSIVQQLSGDLQKEFPGISGFSASNLWRMKSFFEAYASSEKLAQLVREIGWSHNCQATAGGTQRGAPGHGGDREAAGGCGMRSGWGNWAAVASGGNCEGVEG